VYVRSSANVSQRYRTSSS